MQIALVLGPIRTMRGVFSLVAGVDRLSRLSFTVSGPHEQGDRAELQNRIEFRSPRVERSTL